MTVNAMVAQLRRAAMFAGVDPKRLEPLATRAFLRRFSRGQVVFTAGEPGYQLFAVRTAACVSTCSRCTVHR